MDTTDCLNLPYPQCEPGFLQDASDIVQLRDLAEATDTAVQAYADNLQDTLITPDYVLVDGASNSAAQDVLHFFFSAIYDPAGMFDTNADVIRILETGWYMVGAYHRITTGVSVFARAEPIVNGDVVSSRQGFGLLVNGTEDFTWTDVLYLQQGDALQFATHHANAPGPVLGYSFRMWALRILANV